MTVSQLFGTKDVYYAALLGGMVGYLGLVLLVALSVVVGGQPWGEVFNVFIMGLLFASVPALLMCAVIVAPLGALIALKALGSLPDNRWHGALTGVLTALAIIIGFILFGASEWREAPDAGTIAFLGGALVIAAATGWLTQRRFLPLTIRD